MQTHTSKHPKKKVDSYWQTHTNHLRELTWADFILLFIALRLIFAEGLTDITEFHFTYQDLIPVVFTKHSLCVCDCVCRVGVYTYSFVWGKNTRGTEGQRLACQPMSIYCSWTWSRQSTSGRMLCLPLYPKRTEQYYSVLARQTPSCSR